MTGMRGWMAESCRFASVVMVENVVSASPYGARRISG
jgi:hypothetical protein